MARHATVLPAVTFLCARSIFAKGAGRDPFVTLDAYNVYDVIITELGMRGWMYLGSTSQIYLEFSREPKLLEQA